MSNFSITTSECAWANFEVQVFNRVIRGLRGFEFKKEKEKEAIYGAGDEPIDIQHGQSKYSGNIKLLGFEADLMNKAAVAAGYADLTEVPHDQIVITCSFKKLLTDPVRKYVARGCGFSEIAGALEQNAKHREVTLPFVAMRIEFPQ